VVTFRVVFSYYYLIYRINIIIPFCFELFYFLNFVNWSLSEVGMSECRNVKDFHDIMG